MSSYLSSYLSVSMFMSMSTSLSISMSIPISVSLPYLSPYLHQYLAIYQLIYLFVPLLIYLSLCIYSRPQHYHPRRQGGTTTTSRGRSPPYSPRPNATATSCVIHAPLPEDGLHHHRPTNTIQWPKTILSILFVLRAFGGVIVGEVRESK